MRSQRWQIVHTAETKDKQGSSREIPEEKETREFIVQEKHHINLLCNTSLLPRRIQAMTGCKAAYESDLCFQTMTAYAAISSQPTDNKPCTITPQ